MPTQFIPDPASSVPVCDYVGARRAESGNPGLSRRQVLVELADAGFQVGVGKDGRAYIAGLGYKCRPALTVLDGRIVAQMI